MVENNQEEFESKFNTGVAQVMRLNDLVGRAHSEYLDGGSKSYKAALNRIWMEIRTYCDEKQIKRRDVILNNNPKYKPIPEPEFDYFKGLQDWEDKKEKRTNIIEGRVYAKLIAYENLIREIMRELGFLGIKKEDMKKMRF